MRTENFITLKNENEILRIRSDEILYVTVEGKILTCKTEDETIFHCTMALNRLVEELPEYFLRISRSCLVNVKKIKRYYRHKKLVILSDGSEHKVAGRRLKSLLKYLEG
ncbi:LytR/AlgR family response regulator transcription factor [Belliella marina]|uniref:LytR/AlgR family response regulator transcription factor n=1 Tax=Belliella marina TaxID=1644146 RepID=A0ABW4VPZ2_9BACT